MAALGILGQKVVDIYGQWFVFTRVSHDGGSNTVSVDQSADTVRVFPLDGQTTPTVTLGSSDSNFLKDVTVSGGGSGTCLVVTWHKTAVAGSKV